MDVQPLELLCHEPFDDCLADDYDHLEQDGGSSVLGGEGSAAALMLPELRELDVSYCHLPTEAICCLLGQASRLTVGLMTPASPCAPAPAFSYMGFAFCCIGSRHCDTATLPFPPSAKLFARLDCFRMGSCPLPFCVVMYQQFALCMRKTCHAALYHVLLLPVRL